MGITTHLTTFGRILIIMTMFLGRLGPLTLAFAMARAKRKSHLRYPEEKNHTNEYAILYYCILVFKYSIYIAKYI